MKIFLVFISFLHGINSYSQDSIRIVHIDSLVASINKMNLQVHKDSATQKLPDSEISMKTYFTTVFDNGVLKKYECKMTSSDSENGIFTPFINSTTFYYDQDQLIKIEESRLQFEKRSDLDWYYFNDKLLKYTGKDPARANSLLATANEFFKRIHWRK